VLSLTGLGVSPGVASGRAFVVRPGRRQVFYLVSASLVGDEVDRLTRAQALARAQVEDISARLARLAGSGPASLFEAQLLMLADPMLVDRAVRLIVDHRYNAEWAIERAAGEIVALLDGAQDPYLRERHGDVRDVVGRVVRNLHGRAQGIVLPEGPEPWLIVADELTPSMAAQVNWERASGFVSEVGSWTSHHPRALARHCGGGRRGAGDHAHPAGRRRAHRRFHR
jgi:phosphotransferase system enzyme I (PtsI)